MNILLFDLSNGATEDMLLSSFADLGVKISSLLVEIKKKVKTINSLTLKTSSIKWQSTVKATRISISGNFKNSNKERYKISEIMSIIKSSTFCDDVKSKAVQVLQRIEKACESNNCSCPVTLDSKQAITWIVVILCFILSIQQLGAQEIYASPPAVNLNALKDVNLSSSPALIPSLLINWRVKFEEADYVLTTPLIAGIIATFCKQVSDVIPFYLKVTRIGLGRRDNLPGSVLRVILADSKVPEEVKEEIMCVETNLDDISPQVIGYLYDKLFEQNALDVFVNPVYMKKNRPGFQLSVLTRKEDLGKIQEVLFNETTTIGVRYYTVQRVTKYRDVKQIATTMGKVKVKHIWKDRGQVIKVPEYDDCVLIAKKLRLPLHQVISRISYELNQRK